MKLKTVDSVTHYSPAHLSAIHYETVLAMSDFDYAQYFLHNFIQSYDKYEDAYNTSNFTIKIYNHAVFIDLISDFISQVHRIPDLLIESFKSSFQNQSKDFIRDAKLILNSYKPAVTI